MLSGNPPSLPSLPTPISSDERKERRVRQVRDCMRTICATCLWAASTHPGWPQLLQPFSLVHSRAMWPGCMQFMHRSTVLKTQRSPASTVRKDRTDRIQTGCDKRSREHALPVQSMPDLNLSALLHIHQTLRASNTHVSQINDDLHLV